MDQPIFNQRPPPQAPQPVFQQPMKPGDPYAPINQPVYGEHAVQMGMPDQGAPVEEVEFCGIKCTKNYSLFLRIIAAIVCLATMIFEFIQLIAELSKFSPADVLICLYCEFFALICLVAELRVIECWRKLSFVFFKHCYFFSTFIGRGLFYIFFGSMLMGSGLVGDILGFSAVVVGALNILLYVFCFKNLTDFSELDKQQLQAYQQHVAEHGQAPPPPTSAELGLTGGAALAYDNRQHINAENAKAGYNFYQNNKQHLNQENFDRAQRVAGAANSVQQGYK